MKYLSIVSLALVIAVSTALPVPEDTSSTAAVKSSDEAKESSGVASTLTQGTKSIVDTKTTLLKGLTGAVPSSLQADASSTNEAVQRNERGSSASGFSGYPSSSYGPNTVAETPNNFINVFSQAAANTVNFGTQLLNSLVGVAANILQGTVSTLLSLLNAKGQIVGAVVQSAPPVLASVTRTAGDVLAAKARIFGAVTQSAVNFASQLAQTITNTFSALFNGPNALNFSALTGGGGRGLDGSGPASVLGGVGNFAQTAINTKLNLLNGLLSPFTGGRPLLNFGGGSSGGNPLAALFNLPQSSSSSHSGSGGYPSASEPNFRITIAASTPAPAKDDTAASGSTPNRSVRFFQPVVAKPPQSDDLNPGNLLASLGGLFGGMLNQLSGGNANRNRNLARGPDSSNTFLAQILPNANAKPVTTSSDAANEAVRKQLEQSLISSLLQNAFTNNKQQQK
ncbi:uncharacterized protein LOC110851492 isoform X2 [Folsomia candida]|uniref:uncharacterized protein LOC110851492 isoform X2 n=1 Tax=Folsomia candida TaxID=158441 RepID=UPI000B90885C|nr:uncharacterized protein LOC110851492 isoform X2 [Folsomia candida]